MRASNECIRLVVDEYKLEKNALLQTIDKHHAELTGIETCIDHATFVAPLHMRQKFMNHWERLGLTPMAALHTTQYPAEHIALTDAAGQYGGCSSMIGLSVSADPLSPINQLHTRYTKPPAVALPGNLQHIAVNVDPDADMEDLIHSLSQDGVRFMTPPLVTTQQKTLIQLRQIFTACTQPYSYFLELIQRRSVPAILPDGNPQEQLFNPAQIDALYGYYAAYSDALPGKQE